MKYLCLVYVDENALDDRTSGERSEPLAGVRASSVGARAARLAAETVEAAAVTLRKRDGQLAIADGAVADTEEQLRAFVLIDAANLDDAIDFATRVPAARWGSVEVRPVRELAHDMEARSVRGGAPREPE